MSGAADVAVIGGGLHGLSAALALARQGRRVVLLERDHCGRHASGANAGGVRTLMRHEAEIPLALASQERWRRLADSIGDDCGYHETGQLAVAEDPAALQRLSERASRLAALGYGHERMVDRSEVRQLAPGVAAHVTGGLWAPGDGAAVPYRAAQAFRAAAVAAGVEIREHSPVTGLARGAQGWTVTAGGAQIRAEAVVNAAGAWGDRIAALAGDRIALDWFLPMMMVTARVPQQLAPVIINLERPLSFKQLADGGLLIGGGRPGRGSRDDLSYRMDFAGLRGGAAAVATLFPQFAEVPILRAWCGFEGRFPDDLPVIGPSPTQPGLFHVFGFCGHGFQLSPIVGELVADLVLGRRPALPLAPFDPARHMAPAAA